MRRLRSLLPISIVIGMLSLGSPAYAATLNNLQYTDVATFQSLEGLFSNLIKALVSLSGVALFLMLLVGGFSFLFSSGDPKKLEQARGTITNAIMGLIIIVSAYLILRLIKVFTGVEVTLFKIPLQ